MKGSRGRWAWTVKVGERGQFVIPKEARDIFGIKPGDTLIVLADEKKGIAIPPESAYNNLLSLFFKNGDPDTDEAASSETAEEADRND